MPLLLFECGCLTNGSLCVAILIVIEFLMVFIIEQSSSSLHLVFLAGLNDSPNYIHDHVTKVYSLGASSQR